MEEYFNQFKAETRHIELPSKFTFPFNYTPHPLTILAKEQVKDHLQKSSHWHYSAIANKINGEDKGRMFGVLIVKNSENNIGFLAAVSGNTEYDLGEIKLIPSIYNVNDPNGFYRMGEQDLNHFNHKIKELESSKDYLHLQTRLQDQEKECQRIIDQKRNDLKQAKAERKAKRDLAKQELNSTAFTQLEKQLVRESNLNKQALKSFIKSEEEKISSIKAEIKDFEAQIQTLRTHRKEKSAAIQQQLFDQYNFLNIKGEAKNVRDIFKETSAKVPPAAAGDCAGPKLLQFAFQNQLTPIAMAEFWWGPSPKAEVRKHEFFYPACNSKCKPILGHMLDGLNVEENPMLNTESLDIEMIYDDDDLALINKPSGLLSVPGKDSDDSVFARMSKKYPNATGPLIVHRLDMSTSGLMLIAKTKEIHEQLQKQFLNHTIKKRYIALLDGIIKDNEGTIELPLRVDLDDRPRQVVCSQYGKAAKTEWRVVEQKNNQTLIHFFPITGRTHQLRMHAAHHDGLNTPIVGDELYGKKAQRLCLHAEQIEFIHPKLNQKMTFCEGVDFP